MPPVRALSSCWLFTAPLALGLVACDAVAPNAAAAGSAAVVAPAPSHASRPERSRAQGAEQRRTPRVSAASLPARAEAPAAVVSAEATPRATPSASAEATPSAAPSVTATPNSSPSAAATPSASATSAAAAPAPSAPATASFECAPGMQHLTGGYCRNVEQTCLEYILGKDDVPDESRCLRYAKPSVCLDTAPRVEMDYCMDTFEYPNVEGQLPRTLVDWTTARQLCEEQGKRLCTESEFNFACEGEEMRPYVTGFERPQAECNIDQPFLTKRLTLQAEPLCLANPACAREFARLDQRRPIGSSPGCVSSSGVRDLNGNVNEWTSRMWRPAPRRAALKGGWWGPVRNRCRAIALSHYEDYVGYEVGFRCCSDGSKAAAKRR